MTDKEQGLKRELTARQMAMVAVGGSIGTGLLLGSGAAIQVAGPAVVLTFVLSALISWTVAMALGEMSAVHPAAGSFGVYAELYVNRWAGFIARYGYWFSVVIAIGSEVVAAATYMRQWYPSVPAIVWMVTFSLFLLAINLFSVGHYGTFEYWFALLKVITIFVFIVMGAALLFAGKVRPQYVASGGFVPLGWSAPLMAISFGLYSFLGIEMVAISSGEARSRKDIAKATRLAFAMLAFIYIGAMAVLVGVMPWRNAGVSESPFVTVFKVAGIPAASFIMNLVVLSAALSGANAKAEPGVVKVEDFRELVADGFIRSDAVEQGRLRIEFRKHLEASHARHFDIEKEDVWFRLDDAFDGFHRVRARARDFNASGRSQHSLQTLYS